MKKSVFLLCIGFIALYSCQQAPKNSFTINGDLEGLKDPYIYFRWRGADTTYLDSSVVTDGKFSFDGKAAEPGMAILYLKNYKSYVEFFLENADMHITGVADSMQDAKITGSQAQEEWEAYKSSLKDDTGRQDSLRSQYGRAKKSGDTAAMAGLQSRLDALSNERKEKTKAFIISHPRSFVSLSRLYGMTYSTPYAELNKLYMGLDTALQHSAAGKDLGAHLAIMEKTSVGKPALAFTQDDVGGKPVSLSDFKGKYVLVDFWASWCGPCRAENPNVVKAYNKYKDKGFTVLGVSLDDDSSKWMKAIADDHLAWTQVSDLKGWKNEAAQEYGVNAIPSNYLIDPNGIIIGHNLRGKALEDKLAEVLK